MKFEDDCKRSLAQSKIVLLVTSEFIRHDGMEPQHEQRNTAAKRRLDEEGERIKECYKRQQHEEAASHQEHGEHAEEEQQRAAAQRFLDHEREYIETSVEHRDREAAAAQLDYERQHERRAMG